MKQKLIKVDEETHKRLKIYCAENYLRSINGAINDLLDYRENEKIREIISR